MNKYLIVKRLIDIFIALLGLIILIPVFLTVVVYIKTDSKGPVFIKQRRIGKNKKEFNIINFRTMKIDIKNKIPTHVLTNQKSIITNAGKILIRTSLDELPQLLNVIRGDMSFIGPRPALWNQYDLIEIRDKYNVHSVLPGITGWSQINETDELSNQKISELDGEYISKLSMEVDLMVLYKTIFLTIPSNLKRVWWF